GSPRTANAKLTKRPAESATIIVLLGENRSTPRRIRGRAWLPSQTRRSARPRRIASPVNNPIGDGAAGDANPTAIVIRTRARMSSIRIVAVTSCTPGSDVRWSYARNYRACVELVEVGTRPRHGEGRTRPLN